MPIVTRRTRAMVAPANLLPTETTRRALALLSTLGDRSASTRGPDGATVLHVAVGALLAIRAKTWGEALRHAAGDDLSPAACARAGQTGLHGHALAVAFRIGISVAIGSALARGIGETHRNDGFVGRIPAAGREGIGSVQRRARITDD